MLELFECPPEFGLRIHDDRAIPGHRFPQRLPRDKQKSDAVLTTLDDNFVASIEEHERAVVDLGRRRRMRPPADPLSAFLDG